MGRRLKYSNNEERRAAIKESKTRYMLNKPWKCPVCDHDYSLAGKWSHMKTKKHIYNAMFNALKDDDDFDIIPAE